MQGLKLVVSRFLHSDEPLLFELVSVGAVGVEDAVELGGGASEEVDTIAAEEEELDTIEELKVLEAILPEASVMIIETVFDSVIEASRGPSSPQANGKAGSNVARLHAEVDGSGVEVVELAVVEPLSVLESVDMVELVALALALSVSWFEDAD